MLADNGQRIALQARLVFPVSAPPIVDGVVTLEGERILEVAPAGKAKCEGIDSGRVDLGRVDLGNVAILPGLVNVHTHLELSDAEHPLGTPNMAFPDWIRLVIEFRRQRAATDDSPVRRGLEEVVRCGTTLVGEIALSGWSPTEFDAASTDAIVFLEAIGLSHNRVSEKMAEARQHLATAASAKWRPGISPHAPYTVRPELFAGLVALAAEAHAPMAFHLAESREELQLLATGDGPFRELFEQLGVWDPAAIPRGTRPLDYLKRMASAGVQALAIHGNYLADDEIELLARHRKKLSVVYCPRTHAYFDHARHPLPRLLAAGANVALGTDSRASNPDLNLLEEMRFVRRDFPELSLATILELGTLRGAEALGLAESHGSLAPGKLANLAIIPLPDRDADPHELLFEAATARVQSVYRGAWR